MNVAAIREETPGCQEVAHFNNAGAALIPRLVLNAVIDHLQLESQIGGYEAETRELEKIEHVYDAVASLIGCDRKEVAMVENATRAWDMAFYSIPFQKGDRILTAKAEYASNYIAYLQVTKRTGAQVDVIPNDAHGQVSLEKLKKMLDDRVKLIAITHVPTNSGLVNPAEEIGRVAKESGILYLLDACQSVGQMPVDVNLIQCDMLSATGRKYLRGPRGTGFLYVRNSVLDKLEPPFLDLHAATWTASDDYEIRRDARRFENWESNIAGKIGLGVAIDYALNLGLSAIRDRIQFLAEMLRSGLKAVPGVKVCDPGLRRCGIVSFTMDGVAPEEIRARLWKSKINVWRSTVESTRLDMEERKLEKVVRASVHYYNTEGEIERLLSALRTLSSR
ncbi:aminotransferase class V-fold PLP-dependent enzyme [bacterium]|nr:aminotransferase class V-fold PLP-dependent enzyme [bacterium]